MEFFRIRRDIPFMRHALVFNVISVITFLLAVFFLATRGLNFGVDFKRRDADRGLVQPPGRLRPAARRGRQAGRGRVRGAEPSAAQTPR